MNGEFHSAGRGWIQKFRDAGRGVWLGMKDQSSFQVHLPMALAVVVAGVVLQIRGVEWAVLSLAIGAVLAAEMFNSALEHLGKAVDTQHNPRVGAALDIGSAAVLVASLAAVACGLAVLGPHLVAWLWPVGS